MRSRILAIFVSVLLFLSAIFVIGFPEKGTAVNLPSATSQSTTEPVPTVICSFSNVSYGSHKDQTLDLTLPIDDRAETGLLLYIHGGGWVDGDKSAAKTSYRVHADNKRYATASINYRLAEKDKTDIYDILDDITSAITCIKNFASGYGVNLNKVIICGYSAGGHLALLYSYRYKQLSPIEVVGVFASAPAVDLTLEEFYTNNSLGDEAHMCDLMSKACGEDITVETRNNFVEVFKEFSPTTYVSENSVPTVISHGKNDKIAPYKGSELLARKLTEFSVEHDLITFDSGHKLGSDQTTKEYAEKVMQNRINEWLNIN